MKKLIVLAIALGMASLISVSPAKAQEGDLEISGHVNTVTGWQRVHGNSGGSTASAGVLTDGLAAPGTPETDQFGFFADEVEIDVAKQFGENIRLRADLDFTPGGNRSGQAGGQVGVEQAYITFNVPVGNGAEWLIGRFNSGIGLDAIDRNELSTVSFSTIHRRMLPHNVTGMDFYYAFNDQWSFDIIAVNDLQDAGIGATSDIPSGGFHLQWSNAEAGEGSWIRLSGLVGPEQATKKNLSFIGDIAASFNAAEGFYIDLEGLYRQDDSGGADNAQYIAGTLQLRYQFSDIWDGTLRAGYLWDLDSGQGTGAPVITANPLAGPTGLGFAGQQYDLTLATGYEITDGARFVIEGRYDLQKPSAGGSKNHIYGAAAGFFYDF
jgi:hypothetical protein